MIWCLILLCGSMVGKVWVAQSQRYFSSSLAIGSSLFWYQARVSSGISSQVWPFSSRPLAFFERFTPSEPQPPHCLKKKAAPKASHWRWMLSTHSCFIGRALAPDSPPTMTQWMSVRFSSPKSSSKGSAERKRIAALMPRRQSILGTPYSRSSTETPAKRWPAVCAG